MIALDLRGQVGSINYNEMSPPSAQGETSNENSYAQTIEIILGASIAEDTSNNAPAPLRRLCVPKVMDCCSQVLGLPAKWIDSEGVLTPVDKSRGIEGLKSSCYPWAAQAMQKLLLSQTSRPLSNEQTANNISVAYGIPLPLKTRFIFAIKNGHEKSVEYLTKRFFGALPPSDAIEIIYRVLKAFPESDEIIASLLKYRTHGLPPPSSYSGLPEMIDYIRDRNLLLSVEVYSRLIEHISSHRLLGSLQAYLEIFPIDIHNYLYSDNNDEDGFTPLHIAAKYGDKDMVEFLLSKGAQIDLTNEHGFTPLHIAAKYGDKNMVEFLLSKGARIDADGCDNTTPLYMAAENGQKDVVEFLLEKGARIDIFNFDTGYLPIHEAVRQGRKDIVELFLEKEGQIDVTSDGLESTPLHVAAECGYIDMVELLVAKGARIDVIDTRDFTPLHEAAQRGRKDVVEFLLAKGAQIDARSFTGETPLHVAVESGRKDVVEFLLAKGAQIDAANFAGQTPMGLALAKIAFARISDIWGQIFTILSASKAKIETQNNEVETRNCNKRKGEPKSDRGGENKKTKGSFS